MDGGGGVIGGVGTGGGVGTPGGVGGTGSFVASLGGGVSKLMVAPRLDVRLPP